MFDRGPKSYVYLKIVDNLLITWFLFRDKVCFVSPLFMGLWISPDFKHRLSTQKQHVIHRKNTRRFIPILLEFFT